MSLLLDQFRRSMDPFLLGCSDADVAALGLLATGGLSFPLFNGALMLRRRPLYPTVGPWTFCGAARLDAAEVTGFPGFAHDANQAYEYASGVALGNGFVGEWSEPTRLDFDFGGALIAARLPSAPKHLTVEPIAGGKFALTWEYDGFGQGTPPTDFQVFEGAEAGSVNYAAPLTDSVTGLDAVPVRGKRRRFEFTTAAFTEGTAHVFAVRARNIAATAEKNTFASVAKTARTTAAPIAAIVSAVMRRA